MLKKYRVTVNGQSYDVTVEEQGGAASPLASAPVSAPSQARAPAAASAPSAPVTAGGNSSIKAPMPGTVLSIRASAGQAVKKGEVILVLEAMKMENEISAPMDGTISKIHVQAGSTVNTGDPMVDLS